MRPNPDFLDLDLEFWSVIRLLNQRLDYHQRKSKKRPNPRFVIPTPTQIVEVFEKEELDYSRLVNNNFTLTKFGEKITSYFIFRDKLLYDYVEQAIQGRAKDLQLGRTSELIKSALGAIPTNMKLYVKHKSGVSNLLLKPIIHSISPSEFELRRPFKSNFSY